MNNKIAIFDIMDILYRNVPETIYNLIADKQCELKKKKRREVSQSEAITSLLKEFVPLKDNTVPVGQKSS